MPYGTLNAGTITPGSGNTLTISETIALGTVTSGTISSGVVQVMPRNKGLIVDHTSDTAVNINADYLTVYDTNNYGVVLSTINLTMTITSTGAGGRSATENGGSEDDEAWYHLWVIYNGSSMGSYGTLASAESTVFADLPSGYTHLKYVGAIYNDSGSNLEGMYQVDNDVTILEANGGILSNIEINALTSYDLAQWLPDTVTSAHFSMRIKDTNLDSYRASFTFYLTNVAYPNSYIVAEGGTTDDSTQDSGLDTFDTIKVSPIINRTIHINTSSSTGDTFTLRLVQYTHNNII